VAKSDSESFDVLTFYIYVMALLTVIVGGFALWNKKKVDAEVVRIKAENTKLTAMEGLAADTDLRGWIARDREGRNAAGGGTPADFQALYLQRSRENGVQISNHTSQGSRQINGGTELVYRLNMDGCRVENLVRFLVRVEEDWPGAKVKQIVKLDWNERTKGWDASVELSIFRATV
jgi:hypothetical protein